MLRRCFAPGSQQTKRLASTDHGPKVTVWWDASCPLCTKEIQMFKRLDKKHNIDFQALTSSSPDTVTVNACPRSKTELLKRFHAQERGQDLVSGAAAFGVMWRAVPGPLNVLGQAMKRPVVLYCMEKLYSIFLIVRPGMQRLARGLAK